MEAAHQHFRQKETLNLRVDKMDLKEVLQEYVATANNPAYNGDYEVINSKFPELADYDPEVLKEYVATANNPSYGGDFNTINSKFPEFGFETEQTTEESTTTTPTPEPDVEGWEAIQNANDMEHADWWGDRSEMGDGFSNWSFKKDPTNPADEGTWSRTLDDGSVQTVGRQTTIDSDGFQVQGWQSNFLDEDAATELGDQLELQSEQTRSSNYNFKNTGKLTEDSEEETEYQVKVADFNRKNPDFNVFDFELDPKGGMVATEPVTLQFTRNDGGLSEKVYPKGHVFDFKNDPFLKGETLEKLKEIYGILDLSLIHI